MQAVESATRACKVTEWKNPTCLIALAAAYAETGEFAAALEWAEKAVALLPPDHPELKPWKEYIAKYKQKKPHRDLQD